MTMDTNQIHDLCQQITALSERTERQYQALGGLQAALSHQSLVLNSLLEHHEDLATLGPDAAEIPPAVLTILRDQVARADASRDSVSAILKPDRDAATKQLLDRMTAEAWSKIRPDAA